MANATAHQRNILEIQKPVEVFYITTHLRQKIWILSRVPVPLSGVLEAVLPRHVDEDEAVHLHLLLEGVAGLQKIPPQQEKEDSISTGGGGGRMHSKIDRKQINVLHINWNCFFSMLYITQKVFLHRILFKTGYSKSRLTSFSPKSYFKFKLLFKMSGWSEAR